MKFRPKLILRKGATLAALIAPVAGGCADSPASAFRASIDDVCAALTACGMPDEACATPESRREVFDEISAELAGESEECRDVSFEVYADYYVCLSNLSCDLIDVGGEERCFPPEFETRLENACPDL